MSISVADSNFIASKALMGRVSPSASGITPVMRHTVAIDPAGWMQLGEAASIGTKSFVSSNEMRTAGHVVAIVSCLHLSSLSFFTDDLVVGAITGKTPSGDAVIPRRRVLVSISESDGLNELATKVFDALPAGIREPSVWADVGEIAFEWKWGTHHAILSLDEDGAIGYAMLQDDHYKPGSESFSLERFPKDLEEYLGQP